MACYDDMGGEVSEGGLRRQENKNPTLRMWGKNEETGGTAQKNVMKLTPVNISLITCFAKPM